MLGDALASYFDNAASARRNLTPMDEVDALFDDRENHFPEIESRAESLHAKLPQGTASMRQKAARKLVDKNLDSILHRIVNSDAQLETEIARQHAHQILVSYAVTAAIMPMELFRQQAQLCGFDIELLADDFGVDFELVCERLSAMPVIHL